MKKFVKIFLIVIFCWFFLLPVIGGIGFILWGAYLEHRISRCDHQAVLLACRTMIAERQNYYRDYRNPDAPVVIQPVENSEVPAVIKNMHPHYIVIGTNYVQMCFSALPRVYLFCFTEGAKQYGNKQLIDGLWLSQ